MYPAVTHFIKQHINLDERVVAARVLQSELASITISSGNNLEVLVDSMDNYASHFFGALPERLAIVYRGKLSFLGGRGPEDYSIQHCREALIDLLASEASCNE